MTFSPIPVTHCPMRHRLLNDRLVVLFCLLLSSLFILAGCQSPAVTALPEGAGRPRPVDTALASTPDPSPSPAPTFTPSVPTAAPLPMLDRPLVWYAQGPAPENAQARVDELNRLLLERGLNAKVDIRYVETGLFERRMAEARAAGEVWDLVTLSGEQYDLWLGQGFLLPLPVDSIPAPALAALERAGHVYAVPAPAVWARPRGISVRADVAQALGLQEELKNLRRFQDLTALLEKVQAAIDSGALKTAGIQDADALQHAAGSAAILFPEASGYSGLWGPLALRADSSDEALVNWYETSEFQELAALRLAWQQAGVLPKDPLTPDQLAGAYREGRYAVEIGQLVFPGSEEEQAARFGYEWLDFPLTPAWITTENVLSSVTGINAQAAGDPERARRAALLLAGAHADADIFRLLSALLGWEGGVSLEEIRHWNAQAQPAPGLGFVFDARPVGAEAAMVTGEAPEWLEPLANGQNPDVERAVKGLNRFLDSAGIGTIRQALEEQYAAWRSARE